jgi:hypothetical protein
MGGRREEPLRFYPLERFERVLGKKRILKAPVGPFTLPPHEIHTEQLRFISQKVFDIPPGGYAVDVELGRVKVNKRVKDKSDVDESSEHGIKFFKT